MPKKREKLCFGRPRFNAAHRAMQAYLQKDAMDEEDASMHPRGIVFTRFFPAQHPAQGIGIWERYYERWSCMNNRQLGFGDDRAIPDLQRLMLQAIIIDASYPP
jgi:hypothetical protein